MSVRITRADGLITRADAALLSGVRPDTVSQWISRGYRLRTGEHAFLPVAKREGRTVLLDPVEVQKAEYHTAKRARRDIFQGIAA